MVRYTEHAEFQLERRGINKAWVEDTILNPDETETEGNRQSFSSVYPAGMLCCAL